MTKPCALGFTLVEVLVAVAVLGFTIPAVMSLMMQQTDSAGTLRDKTIAHWIAENKVTELRLQHHLSGQLLNREQRDSVDMAGVQWQQTVAIEQTLGGALVRYRVQVGRDVDSPLVTLDTYLNN
ncbi:MAG: type II secretion system minor pseudopilin GspI [Cellvibrionaceae bacterium]|nr:type II secretion system minor pseudopilin GspI [Cellvibrionaceae bacterium]